MKAVIPFYKKRGETPKEALTRLSKEEPRYRDEALSYAGRLDPLAEGLLLILVGDANKEREKHLRLPKKYHLEILFGWSTDTYDIAGRLTDTSESRVPMLMLMKEIGKLVGVSTKNYPPFSSKPVKGRPLFMWAREGRLNEITIPTHTVEINKIQLTKAYSISGMELDVLIHESLSLLTGDFRQEEIRACWEENLKGIHNKEFDVVALNVSCGSGAYMRQLAHELGQHLCIPALALSIMRTEVGPYTLADAKPISAKA